MTRPGGILRRRRAALLGPAAACLLASLQAAAGDPVRVVYFFSDGRMPVTLAAYKTLLAEHPELRGEVDLRFVTESLLEDVDAEQVASADVLVFDTMNQQMLERFDAEHDVDLLARVAAKGHFIAVGEGLLPKEHYVGAGAIWDERARAFWEHSGEENQLGLLEYALRTAGVEGVNVPEPTASLDAAYYYPAPDGAAGAGQLFASWDAFDRWRDKHGKRRPGAPRVAIGFYKANYYTGDTEVVDALVAEIERQGAEAIPFFGYPAGDAFERMLLDARGAARADVALSFLFRFADFEASKSLEKLDIPVLNLVTLYGRSEAEWRASSTGLSLFEGTFQVAVPELAGLVSPTVVGSREKTLDLETGLAVVRSRPITSRLEPAVSRALRYAALARKPNAEKRIALMYYNFPAGKAGISASYLNVAESLANILRRLDREGYDVGGEHGTQAVLDAITKARNVPGFAPGELEAMLQAGEAERVDVEEYARWLDELAPALKAEILADWGRPENVELMAEHGGGETEIIVPVVRYGNVVLLPQPARGWGEDGEQLFHAEDLAPHHQYVAVYAWLRENFGADAVIHVGTHGTLEWLDGKDVGQTSADPSDALLAALPDLYIYNVDVVGEGLVARRRGLATLVDHMVPPFTLGGLYPELAALTETINDYDANLHKNPELAEAYADELRKRVVELGIAKDLGLDLSGAGNLDDEVVHRIERHVLDIKGQNIPYGLHTFGESPDAGARASTVRAIVETDRSLLPNAAKMLAAEMDARIVASGAREMDDLVRALDGGFVPTGGGGEPIRNPDAYPTGKNFYGIDPDKVPKPAAWRLGTELADKMLALHLEQHGRYPEKVSFVIWGDETMRHEGVLESQILYLLGTRPVWDARGKVVDVEVIPKNELGRPRVDIVIASAAEGMFHNVTLLMDKAVQKVKGLDEAENYVRRHYLATRRALVERGYSEDEAGRRAGVRIFDEPPGRYDLNTSNIVAASGTWQSDAGIGDDYLKKMGHGFGNGFWGEPMEDVFRMALAGTEKIVHSSSTMLYGALDNDDFYMYMGGLASAVRNLDGKSPELVVTNTRDPSKPEMSSIDEFLGTEFRSRYVNPTWIEGMQKEGYAGAAHIREFVEYLWGWDATVSEAVDDAMWQDTFEVYVKDKYGLDMKPFFEQKSPFAYQDMTARMIETVRKGYWHADAETLSTLLGEYVGSVERHGINCTEVSCGNPRLLEYVIEQATKAGVPAPAVEAFQNAAEKAIRASIPELAEQAARFIARNEARIAARQVPGPAAVAAPTIDSAELRGYLMRSVEQGKARSEVSPRGPGDSNRLGLLWLAAAVLGTLISWRWRHARG
jgi:cobaltochelatase CobN